MLFLIAELFRIKLVCLNSTSQMLQVVMASNMCGLCYKHLYQYLVNRSTFLCSHKNYLNIVQHLVHNRPAIILGIESSCDDTGCGIIDSNGNILGEALKSQHLTHLNFGGVIPHVARSMHRNNITKTCEDALRAANLKLKDVDAIATTVKPGLVMSLNIGAEFGKYLTRIGEKPFIPIHHMEAHALTVRMVNKVDFPYLVLLVSGGHCLLAIVENVNKFYLLGTSINNAPGEVFDKVARRLRLRNIPEFRHLNGGHAIEIAASRATNINEFSFPPIMTAYRDCNFSFAGLITLCNLYIEAEEKKNNIIGDMLIPNLYNFCAAFQLAAVTHICQRTQRAIEYVNQMALFPQNNRTLVVSGGVASNDFLCKALNIVCTEFGFEFVRTPPKLCSDNGIMIAWNGMEKWITNTDIIRDQRKIEEVEVKSKSTLGEDRIKDVQAANLKCKWVKIKKKLFETM